MVEMDVITDKCAHCYANGDELIPFTRLPAGVGLLVMCKRANPKISIIGAAGLSRRRFTLYGAVFQCLSRTEDDPLAT